MIWKMFLLELYISYMTGYEWDAISDKLWRGTIAKSCGKVTFPYYVAISKIRID